MPAPSGDLSVVGDTGAPQVSVVIPAKDEIGNLPGLIEEIRAALDGKRTFEVIAIDDGSSDGTDRMLATMRATSPWLRPVRHASACGQSCAVRTGLLHARGDIVVTIDGDGQNDPAYIPALVDALEAAGPAVALAAGQRVGRKATAFKRFASKFANRLRGAILKDNTRDSGCGLKAVRRVVFLRLPYFDSWHRFLPALVMREGYGVVHVDVVDRERQHGASKYGVFDRALIGILDLFGVWWLRRRRKSIPIVSEIAQDGAQNDK
ncbi:glycosyltransferase family 2 protein [Breoghania sp. JC706]|uniref:glycosyltransferase family 2 protein n=1 Tax=Breoghania sp. JC706 TaxID=3117732 RepID=UPI003009C9B7